MIICICIRKVGSTVEERKNEVGKWKKEEAVRDRQGTSVTEGKKGYLWVCGGYNPSYTLPPRVLTTSPHTAVDSPHYSLPSLTIPFPPSQPQRLDTASTRCDYNLSTHYDRQVTLSIN